MQKLRKTKETEIKAQEEIKIKMPFVVVRASNQNEYKPEKYHGNCFEWKI